MRGERDLGVLLGNLVAMLQDGVFVFCTLPRRDPPAGLRPVMALEEAEGTTLILREEDAILHGLPHHFRCRMITLDVHSSLDAVGFIAAVASALAEEGLGINPVAGFFHDHLFVPDGREKDVLRILETLRHQNCTP